VTLAGYVRTVRPRHPSLFVPYESPDDRAIPQERFDELHSRFCFTVDVAATPENAKLPRFYTIDDNGLERDWIGERVYCNPPYSQIRPWVEKAGTSGAELVVMVLPANRTEQPWWQELVEPRRDRPGSPLRTEFQSGRWRFLRPGQASTGPNERPPFSIVLLIWEKAERVQ